MTPEPSVSVLLTAYGSPWISDAIESVRHQSRSDWELLVLDDANSGAVRDLVERSGDPRIRYLPNVQRLGPARNHLRGVQLSRAKLVACLNHDDLWEPEFLARLVGSIETSPTAVVAFGDFWDIRETGEIDFQASERASRVWQRARLAPGEHSNTTELGVITQTIPIAQCAVWRKDAIGTIPAWAGSAYDYWIAISLSSSGGSAVYVPERLARARTHLHNLSWDRSLPRRLEHLHFYIRLLREEQPTELVKHFRYRRLQAAVGVLRWPAWRARQALLDGYRRD